MYGAAKAGLWEKCIALNVYQKRGKTENQLPEPRKELK